MRNIVKILIVSILLIGCNDDFLDRWLYRSDHASDFGQTVPL